MNLRAESITLTRHQRTILNRVSLSVREGELVAMVGPNGAGKSTLLRVLSGINAADQGSMTLDGSALNPKHIAYVGDTRRVEWSLSARQVVELGRLPHQSLFRRPSKEDEQAVEEALTTTHTTALAHRDYHALSHGEQARVMLARALATRPQFLLLDEPLSGLDPKYQIEMMQLLHAMSQNGTGIVIVLHDISLALRFASRIVAVKEGKILGDDVPAKLITRQLLRELFDLDAAIGHVHGVPFILPIST